MQKQITIETLSNGKSRWIYNIGIIRKGCKSDLCVPVLVSKKETIKGKIYFWILIKALNYLCN